jgi:hypothetical protein
MEFVIITVVVFAVAGLIIYNLRDENYHNWDD